MDYKEEQNNEIEALDSIYCGDFEILSVSPAHKFAIPVKSEEYDESGEGGVKCSLKFTFTPKYPDEAPEIEIEDEDNMDDNDIARLHEHLVEQAQENMGMVMIFTLVSAAQEWLNQQWDAKRLAQEEHEQQKKQLEEEAERKRFEGTRVNVETFLSWKKNFDIEMKALKKQEKEKDNKKLTGKELFMTDKTLNESDLKFLEEGDDMVKVDESLFEDLDDLDIDVDDEDEEDES